MEEITINVETKINFTESEEKVEKAIRNIFDDISTRVVQSDKEGCLIARSKERKTLEKFRSLLSLNRIRSAARKKFFEGINGKTIIFHLNKQAAFAGQVSFSEEMTESPLGPIRVEIGYNNPRQLINWLAPGKGELGGE